MCGFDQLRREQVDRPIDLCGESGHLARPQPAERNGNLGR
jgi:hypothetical protein